MIDKRRELAVKFGPILEKELKPGSFKPDRDSFSWHLSVLCPRIEALNLTKEQLAEIIDGAGHPVVLIGLGHKDGDRGVIGISHDTTGKRALLILAVGAIVEKIHDLAKPIDMN